MEEEKKKAVSDVLNGGWLTNKKTILFEKFKQYKNQNLL